MQDPAETAQEPVEAVESTQTPVEHPLVTVGEGPVDEYVLAPVQDAAPAQPDEPDPIERLPFEERRQTPQRDALDRMTIGDGVHRIFDTEGLLNGAFDSAASPEERASAWAGIQTWSERTDWMWGDMSTYPLKARMEGAIDFRKKFSERKLLNDAYENGDRFEIGAHQWFMTALRDTKHLKALDINVITHAENRREMMELREAVRDAPRDARIRFDTTDGVRTVTMTNKYGEVLLETQNPQYTINPFDTNPAWIRSPEGAGVLNKMNQVAELAGSLVPLIGVGDKFNADEAAARNWLHEVGIRPTFSVGRNLFDEDGRINSDVSITDDPDRGPLDWFTGGGDHFYAEQELMNRFAVVDSPAAYHSSTLLFKDVLTDDAGTPYVNQEPFTNPVTGEEDPGGRMDLYDIRPGRSVDVKAPGGGTTRIKIDMADMSNAIAGGKVGVNTITGHFFYGKDDVVDTPLGKLLVPKLTGIKLVDKEMMRDPKLLRSMLHADEKYGKSFWTKFSQETVGLAEFVLSVNVGKLAKAKFVGGAKKALTPAMAERLAARGGLGALAAKTVGAWGNVVGHGTNKITPWSVLRFDSSMVSSMVYHETMRGLILNEGSPEEWIKHGVSGGLSFWAFGATASALGRAGQSAIGRGFGAWATEGSRRLKMSERIRGFGHGDPELVTKTLGRIEDRFKASPELRKLQTSITEVVDKEFQKSFSREMSTVAFKHGVHSFSVGAMMGAHAEATKRAMMDLGPEAAEGLTALDLITMGYWGDAWTSGDWMPTALSFASLAGAEYAKSRAWSKAKTGSAVKNMLSPEQEKLIGEVNELVLFNLDSMARNPDAALPIMELMNEMRSHDEVDLLIKGMLGSDVMARDADAPKRVPGNLEYVRGILEMRDGAHVVEEILMGSTPEELLQLTDQIVAVSTSLDGKANEVIQARSILEQIKNEHIRRDKGGAVADSPKPKRERSKSGEIPEPEWREHFTNAEQSYVGGRKRERHQVREKNIAVVQVVHPETQVSSYVIINPRRQKAEDGSLELLSPKEHPFTPEGLHTAMGDALRLANKLKASSEVLRIIRGKEKAEGPELRDAPTDMNPKISEDALLMLKAMRESEFERQAQIADTMRQAQIEAQARESQEFGAGVDMEGGKPSPKADKPKAQEEGPIEFHPEKIYRHGSEALDFEGDRGGSKGAPRDHEGFILEMKRGKHREDFGYIDEPGHQQGSVTTRGKVEGVERILYDKDYWRGGNKAELEKLKKMFPEAKVVEVELDPATETLRVRGPKDKVVPTPERPHDIEAQMEALIDGRKPAVLITPGEAMPKVPRGYKVAEVPQGKLIVPATRPGEATIKQAMDSKTLGHALGYGRGERGAGESVTTARDAQGRVVADIQGSHQWRVTQAANRLAGVGGSVELRTTTEALAERMGLAVPLTMAPLPEGLKLPTAEALAEARQEASDSTKGRRGYGGRNESERGERAIRARDTLTVDALNARVQDLKDNPPPMLVPKAAKNRPQATRKPTAAELDAELLEGVRQSGVEEGAAKGAIDALRASRQAAVESGRQEQATEARESSGPRSELWSGEIVDPVTGRVTKREDLLKMGGDFLTDGGRREVSKRNREAVVFASVQSRALRSVWEAKLAKTQDPATATRLKVQIGNEVKRMESIVAGMLIATGLASGFHKTISMVTGLSVKEVQAVRQGMVRAGSRFDPLIRELLGELRDTQGRRVISESQLNRQEPAGSGTMPTMDALRVAALAPPFQAQLGRGRLFKGGKGKGSLAKGFENLATKEQVHRGLVGEEPVVSPSGTKILTDALVNNGLGAETASKVAEQALGQRISDLTSVETGQRNLEDIASRLNARIGYTMLGNNRAKASSKIHTLPGKPTISEVSQQIIQKISGRALEHVTKSAGDTTAVDMTLLAAPARAKAEPKVEVAIESAEAVRTAEVEHAEPASMPELYHEAQLEVRELLIELMDLRFSAEGTPGGPFILPRDKGGDAATFVADPARSMQATNLLRRLAAKDQGLLELFRRSSEPADAQNPNGEKTYADPEAMFELTSARAQRIIDANQHLLVTMAKESHGAESAKQVRAILEGLHFTSQSLPVPMHLREILSKGTEMFPNGVLNSQQSGIDSFIAESLPSMLNHWIGMHPEAMNVPRSNEMVPLCCGFSPPIFSWSETTRDYRPVRVEALALRKALFGGRDPNAGITPLIGRGRFADFVRDAGGIFGDGGGNLNKLGEATTHMLHGWYRQVGRQLRSRSAPADIRGDALELRHALVSSEHRRDMFFEEMTIWRKRAAEMQMTTAEANVIGKLMMSGAVRRFQTREQWVKVFGDRRSHLFDRLMELSDMTMRLGQWGYETGMWDRETARSMHRRYFPVLEKMFGKSKRKPKTDRQAELGLDPNSVSNARTKSRGNRDLSVEADNLIFDARYAMPMAVHMEASQARIWEALGQVMDKGLITLGSEHAQMAAGSQMWRPKITEPFGGKKQVNDPVVWAKLDPEGAASPDYPSIKARRRHAKIEQTKMHMFVKDAYKDAAAQEKKTGRPMPERRRKILEALENGHWSSAVALEMDLMLDQADPSMTSSAFGEFAQRVSVQWRKLKTIQNPKHWVLNFTNSIVTNHINDKVGVFDFLRSATTGKGLYAEGARDITRFTDWVAEGRPELDPLHPDTLGIMRAERLSAHLGGGTMVRSVFGKETTSQVFDNMFTPDVEGAMQGTEGGAKLELARQAAGVMRRRAKFQKGFDTKFAEIMGNADPRAHAEALMELNVVYYLHELLFKYTAALAGGRHRGMNERDSAVWAAEGTGDYLDRNTKFYERTTNYSAGITNRERRGRVALGKKKELGAFERLGRMGVGSPFWMYQASMWPTLAQSMVDRPVRTAAMYGLMGAMIQGIDELTGGDRQEMQEAMSGRMDHLASALTPEVHAEIMRRWGDMAAPDYGGGLFSQRPSVRDWLSAWGNLKNSPEAFQAPGFNGTVLDFSPLFPGVGEVSSIARTVNNFGKKRPASDKEGIQQTLNIGFMPSAAVAGMLNVWDMAAGVRGQTSKETHLKGLSKILDESFSVAGPVPFLSPMGRRGILAVDGRTLTDVARGLPGAAAPFGQRMGEFATSVGVSTRKVLPQSVEYEQVSFADEALRSLGIRIRTRPSSDPLKRRGEEINRAVNSAIRQGMVNSYKRFIEHDNTAPMQLLINQSLDLRPDMGGFQGARILTDQPRTEPGRFIQKFANNPQDASKMVHVWEKIMLERADALQKFAINDMANKRDVHPAVFERMVDGFMRGENSQIGVLNWLYDVTKEGRPEWARELDSTWLRMWSDADLKNAAVEAGGANMDRWNAVNDWMELNRPLNDPNYMVPMNHPSIYDAPGGLGVERLSPRRQAAPPDFSNFLNNKR